MILITILSLVFLGITHSQQVSKKYAGHALLIPMHIRIPIFNDKEKTSIISYVINDTIKEEYVLVAIHNIKGKMAKVTVTSPLNEASTDIEGWIEKQYLGIHLSNYSDSINIFKKPYYQSSTSFTINKPQWRDFYRIYVSIQ